MQRLIIISYSILSSILLSVLFTISACTAPKDINQTIHSASQALEAKVNNCPNNQERLYTLLQGNFIMYGVHPSDSGLVAWRSNTSKDSMLISVQPIGKPSKDGYLLLYGFYLTQLSDKAFTTYMVKVEQQSRDTLTLIKYDAPAYTLQEMLDKKMENDYDLKTYIDTAQAEPYGVYVKENNTRFRYSNQRRRYIYGGDRPDRYFREMSGSVTLSNKETKNTYYNEAGEYTKETRSYHIRRYHLDLHKWCAIVQEE